MRIQRNILHCIHSTDSFRREGTEFNVCVCVCVYIYIYIYMELLQLIKLCRGAILVQNCLQGDAILPLLLNVSFEYSIRKTREDWSRMEDYFLFWDKIQVPCTKGQGH